ncbi:hypothetical protein CP49_30920 [Bradyrhizobium valentinum]|uniref:Uncharacterized protein n=1 Tax=Bradyrhizobium valentinum TaxID=1518501 RepID=A0A0R3M3X2_9BRAD|nr:hypothetical protein CP49_30920 [Bradyrhizobium valentinum]
MREIHSLSLGLGFANFPSHVRLMAWQAERPMETGRLMSRGAHNFKQGDVTKALKGAVNAGLAVRRFGKPRFYLRAPGRTRVPLTGLPWSPEFMEARQKALDGDWKAPELGVSRTKAGTVNAALVSFTNPAPSRMVRRSDCLSMSW